MSHKFNTNVHDVQFSRDDALMVWFDAFGNDPDGEDACGAKIVCKEYGQNSEHGWHIDHKRPKIERGDDERDNLQPLHWRNNQAKGDTWLAVWTCAIPQGVKLKCPENI